VITGEELFYSQETASQQSKTPFLLHVQHVLMSIALVCLLCSWDLLHLIKNVFTLIPVLTLTLTLKRNYVFGLTKWRHFSIKC